jgi:nucleolar protein 4
MKKSTDNTVFVKWAPPGAITRFHLQDHFSQIGPIKKCSVISEKGYGFVKYLSQEDAQTAASSLNGKPVSLDEKKYTLTVESASNDILPTNPPLPPQNVQDETLEKRKRTSRVIVRNVSFYATENDVKKILEKEYGPVCELTLPRVSDKLHRGFCFVTFVSQKDAQKAVEPRSTPLLIKKRPVAIDFSISKQQHLQVQKTRKHVQQRDKQDEHDNDESIKQDDDDDESESEEKQNDEDDEDDGEDDESESEGKQNDDESESEEKDDDDEDDDDESESEEKDKDDDDDVKNESKAAMDHDDAVAEHRSLFIRNLPFDITRHNLFEVFHKFGHINSIYLVTNKDTGTPKGTAFCTYSKSEDATRALDAARDATLSISGRKLFVDLAVDKKSAAAMVETKSQTGKDRRNLYLKLEGRVDGGDVENSAWENLPRQDQLKRQGAFAEKQTKLRSPLFYINSKRLSIRNLAKHVDEASLKLLCVKATRRGLENKIVTQEDQVAHWRASGDLTTKDIRMQIEQGDSVIPEFDDSSVKRFIPSVYIDRDFTTQKGTKAPSRGFGFVDFEHHVHALACLRELNNNPYYTAEYVTGGKKAVEQKQTRARKRKGADVGEEFLSQDGRALTPRLIVDFTVSQNVIVLSFWFATIVCDIELTDTNKNLSCLSN